MNKYKVQKTVYANSAVEAEDIVDGGETTLVELLEEDLVLEGKSKLGFDKHDR